MPLLSLALPLSFPCCCGLRSSVPSQAPTIVHAVGALAAAGAFASLLFFHIYLLFKGVGTYDWIVGSSLPDPRAQAKQRPTTAKRLEPATSPTSGASTGGRRGPGTGLRPDTAMIQVEKAGTPAPGKPEEVSSEEDDRTKAPAGAPGRADELRYAFAYPNQQGEGETPKEGADSTTRRGSVEQRSATPERATPTPAGDDGIDFDPGDTTSSEEDNGTPGQSRGGHSPPASTPRRHMPLPGRIDDSMTSTPGKPDSPPRRYLPEQQLPEVRESRAARGSRGASASGIAVQVNSRDESSGSPARRLGPYEV